MKDIAISDMHGDDFPSGVKKIEYTSTWGDDFRDWALIMPGSDRKKWATYLHGSLSHGDQVFTRKDVREQIIPRIQKNGWGLLSPNLRNNPRMAPCAVHDLHELINFLRIEFGMEYNVLNGGSMGGTGGIIYCLLHPEDVQRAFIMGACPDIIEYHKWISQDTRPIFRTLQADMESAYGGTPDTIPEVYDRHCVMRHADKLKVPVYFAHGGSDDMIPVRYARELAEKMKNSPDFHYHEIPGGNHDAPLYDAKGYGFIYG